MKAELGTESLVLSLRPHYADLVFTGSKRAELRRRFADDAEGWHVFVYVTSPVRVLRGGFRVDRVWKGAPQELWTKVSGIAAVEKSIFDAYYEGKEVAYALKIRDVWEFSQPPGLTELREELGHFIVPQSWRYAKAGELEWLESVRKVPSRVA